jgi:para-aminobenzoate synthetase component I
VEGAASRTLGGPDPGEGPIEILGRLVRRDRTDGAEGFQGGWFGYLGFETADLLETLPPAPRLGTGLPDLWMAACDWAVVWGPEDQGPRLEGAPILGGDGSELEGRMRDVRRRLEDVPADTDGVGPAPAAGGERPPLARTAVEEAPGLWSTLGREGYQAGVERIREYVRAGDLFQANLTHFLSAPAVGGGLGLFRALADRSPASFAAWLDTGEGEVISISPESFLSLRGRRVSTRPIKGTAPRGRTAAIDERLADALRASAKDRAENVMIVDLLRNDLSRVCRPGTVRVPHLAELESHPTVHHLVSTVEGELEEGAGPLELLRATLPPGSISGAPKIRAVEVIRELEPVRRGVYTGALGLLEASGDLEFSVAIRTAVVRDGWAAYGTGGGITLASDPQEEWRESLDKAVPFLEAVARDAARGEER